jgi:outer membrane lipoprotein-sorting protein
MSSSTQPTQPPPSKQPRILLITLGAFLVIGAALWLAWPRGTPHERLIADIQSKLARVQTVEGTLTISLQGVTLEQEFWAQRPGFLRTETEAGPGAFNGTIVVLNDREGWVYSPALNLATVVDRSAFSEQMAGEAGAGSILERLPDRIIAALQQGTPMNIGDRTAIAGRAATLVELVIPSDDPALPSGPLRVWLDDQYAYPVAWQDASGRELRFTTVAFNREIDPLTFVFYPPPGAGVQRVAPTP